jgi:hypothetical protein
MNVSSKGKKTIRKQRTKRMFKKNVNKSERYEKGDKA